MFFLAVVSYRNSTSNHNCLTWYIAYRRLYLIEILHQTTTDLRLWTKIQSCILSKFYIKPQLKTMSPRPLTVVSYRNSTSNHNLWREFVNCRRLYLIEILHQTTTLALISSFSTSCILSKFYIKPQHACRCLEFRRVVSYRNSTSNHNISCNIGSSRPVVSYRNSTSNHNSPARYFEDSELYLIEILHQTTTPGHHPLLASRLYLIEILHQTTTFVAAPIITVLLYLIEILHQTTTCPRWCCLSRCCILSKFYIKPQHG